MPTLHAYWAVLGQQRQPFPCPLCSQSLLRKHFEKHCSAYHSLDPKRNCVWCLGRVSWPHGQKSHHVDHLMSCMRRFFKPPAVEQEPNRVRSPADLSPAPRSVPSCLTPMDPKQCLFHHAFEPPSGAYDSYCLLPLDPVPLPLATRGLNLASACVRTYDRLKDTTEWFHVMVRVIGFPAFVQALDVNHTLTLPFSCWCDGGTPTEAHWRQHRHFILLSSPRGHFQKWVKTIAFEDRPRKNFRCLFSKPIESAMHLVNTLGYLCKRSSQCAFTGENTKRTEKDNHFYLFEELPKDYRLPLTLLWPEGLDQLLHQQYRNFKPSELVQAPLFREGNKYRMRIRDIPAIPLGTVLPVARDYEPCDEETDACLHLGRNRKLFFKRNPELGRMEPEAWLQRQAVKGNRFFHAVGDDAWTPRPYYQKLLNEFKPFVDQNRDLQAQNRDLQAQNDQRERDHQTLRHEFKSLEAQNRDLLDQRTSLEKELEHWKRKYEALEANQRQTREALQEERNKAKQTLEKQLQSYKEKCQTLERDMKRLAEEEHERLRSELAEANKQLTQLRK